MHWLRGLFINYCDIASNSHNLWWKVVQIWCIIYQHHSVLLQISKKSVKILSGQRIIFYTSRVGKGTWSTQKNDKKWYIDPINYCYENKEIGGERHSNACHLLVFLFSVLCFQEFCYFLIFFDTTHYYWRLLKFCFYDMGHNIKQNKENKIENVSHRNLHHCPLTESVLMGLLGEWRNNYFAHVGHSNLVKLVRLITTENVYLTDI